MDDTTYESTGVAERCGCGRGPDTKGRGVVEDPVYSFWGTLTLLWGVTYPPKHVAYRCLKCHKTLGRTTDDEVMARHAR